MAANTSDRGRARSRGTGKSTRFSCPACEGTLSRTNGSMRCGTCGHVPRHGAD